jgi:hypothetical protein
MRLVGSRMSSMRGELLADIVEPWGNNMTKKQRRTAGHCGGVVLDGQVVGTSSLTEGPANSACPSTQLMTGRCDRLATGPSRRGVASLAHGSPGEPGEPPAIEYVT